ncbi:carboxymuconolactone decarboxylase family protein [Archangium sp.]|uniref:carboxymuconolactone decarboxylase family protein n=1 Tax=Archangium sp. TaxID=1872627 RepID=UPI003899FD28
MLGDERKVQAVLENLDTAPISEAERALFRFVEKVNRESERIQQEDVDAVKATGWSDEALYDAITVCALFNFYNRWADATGVREHPVEVYARGAERLATGGYAGPPQPPPPDKK